MPRSAWLIKPTWTTCANRPPSARVELLRDAGAQVITYEPFKADFTVQGVPAAASLEEALKNADLILMLVGHTQFKTLVPQEVKALTAAAEVVDAVNVWERAAWQAAGFRYLHIGDGKNS